MPDSNIKFSQADVFTGVPYKGNRSLSLSMVTN